MRIGDSPVGHPPSGNRDRTETRTDRPFAARLKSNRRAPRRLQSLAQCVNARLAPPNNSTAKTHSENLTFVIYPFQSPSSFVIIQTRRSGMWRLRLCRFPSANPIGRSCIQTDWERAKER